MEDSALPVVDPNVILVCEEIATLQALWPPPVGALADVISRHPDPCASAIGQPRKFATGELLRPVAIRGAEHRLALFDDGLPLPFGECSIRHEEWQYVDGQEQGSTQGVAGPTPKAAILAELEHISPPHERLPGIWPGILAQGASTRNSEQGHRAGKLV